MELLIGRRGPDGIHHLTIGSTIFTASVLHIQGETTTYQPVTDDHGNVLLWNGEVFGGLSTHVYGQNDTIDVLNGLNTVCASLDHSNDIGEAISFFLSSIYGPYAFIYYHKLSNCVFFGRDPFGRRSLLILRSEHTIHALSSVSSFDTIASATETTVTADAHVNKCFKSVDAESPYSTLDEANVEDKFSTDLTWAEVSIAGVFYVQMDVHIKPVVSTTGKLVGLAPWPESRIKLLRPPRGGESGSYDPSARPQQPQATSVPLSHGGGTDSVAAAIHAASERFLVVLQDAVKCRINSIADTTRATAATTTTGGVDASIVAPTVEVIENQAGVSGAIDSADMPRKKHKKECKVGVLFSGGIDSVLLAAVLHTCLEDPLEPIELINVTFLAGKSENELKIAQKSASAVTTPLSTTLAIPNDSAVSPDRLAALASLEELVRLFPERPWVLVNVDVPADERHGHDAHIKQLIKPCDTQMDLNIGTAFWFAARGKGYTIERESLHGAAVTSGGSPEGDSAAYNVRNKLNRPLLRVGGAGAAAGTGRDPNRAKLKAAGEEDWKSRNADRLYFDGTCSTKIAKYKCRDIKCSKATKIGCKHDLCKTCCDEIAIDLYVQILGDDWEAADEDLCNPCPAHPTKLKNKLKFRNIKVQQEAKHKKVAAKKELAESVAAIGSLNSGKEEGREEEAALLHLSEALMLNDEHKEEPDRENSTAATVTQDSDQCCNSGTSLRKELAIDRRSGATPASSSDSKSSISNNINSDSNDMCGVKSSDSTISTPAESATSHNTPKPYQCTCRALLVGIGADEQMAGYGRHRTVFLKGGWAALEAELNMDTSRLWQRNLGRDDRCISDNGREAWFPYLDEGLVSFLHNLPLDHITNLNLDQGVGDKQVLRGAARLLGLGMCTALVKRAIQFGTLVAKHTNVMQYGSNRKGKGDHKFDA